VGKSFSVIERLPIAAQQMWLGGNRSADVGTLLLPVLPPLRRSPGWTSVPTSGRRRSPRSRTVGGTDKKLSRPRCAGRGRIVLILLSMSSLHYISHGPGRL